MPGWDWTWSSDIEPFPNAVRAARFPNTENLGDVMAGDFLQRASAHGPLDVLVGGPPCQDFSVAGLRKGLEGARGNLSLRWVQIIHALQPRWAVTENVPGWLSVNGGHAFGAFLAGLVGHDTAILPAKECGGRWTDAGMVDGPSGRAAWRILDAQYFGLAQRRRRVFVVFSAGNGGDPAAVLFERASLRGHPAPSRATGERAAPTVARGSPGGRSYGLDVDTCDSLQVARRITTREGARLDPTLETYITGTLCGNGKAAGSATQQDAEAGMLIAHTLRGDGFDAIQAGALRENPASGPDGVGVQASIAYTIEARAEVQAVAFDLAQTTSAANRTRAEPGLPSSTMAKQSRMHVALGFQSSQSGVRQVETHATLDANNGSRRHNGVSIGSSVRRLTPRECERLQGFPDDFTAVPYRGKPAADGPRYKAIGNSMAVPVLRWIGERIALADAIPMARPERALAKVAA